MSSADESIDPLVGSLICGKYRVERLIGRGGMGSVYQGTNTGIGKRVALKFLERDSARDLDAVARFQREAIAASAVESAHIVHIFDSGVSEDGLPFLVLELLTGEDLRARLEREGRLDPIEAAQIAAQVLRALVRAHAAGIVHRDLKPDNVYLCERDDGELFVKIVDFGISKIAQSSPVEGTLTRRGTVLGTAFYMSPEQAQAFADLDGRTDLYSLGAILYEALAGRPPHAGSVYEAILVNICTKDAEDVRMYAANVPESLARVIAKALARDRAHRYQSAAEFLDALMVAVPEMTRTSYGRSAPAFAVHTAAAVSAQERDPALETVRGTAVQTRDPEARKRRATTLVVLLVVALAGFTALAMTLKRAPSNSAAAPATATPIGAVERERPVTVAPEPTNTVGLGADVQAPIASSETRALVASSAEPPRTEAKKSSARVKERTKPPASSSARERQRAGIASGLQLKTTVD